MKSQEVHEECLSPKILQTVGDCIPIETWKIRVLIQICTASWLHPPYIGNTVSLSRQIYSESLTCPVTAA